LNPATWAQLALTHERCILTDFAGELPVEPVELDERYELNWVMKTRDGGYIEAWVAVLWNPGPKADEPVRLDIKKWKDGLELHRLGGKPFYIVMEWDGDIYYVRHDEAQDHVVYGIGGCTGSDLKESPCVLIPSDLFKRRTGASLFVM
jgi:hypothetical protein